ncbi:WbqC family protein [Pseudoalteromonas sp. SaAl2]
MFPVLSSVFEQDNLNTVAQFNIALIKALMGYIGISTPTFISSALSNVEGVKDSRLVSLSKILDCDVYLSPIGAKDYIEEFTPGGQLVKKQNRCLLSKL